MITIGSRFRCNKRAIDAESYYLKKLKSIDKKWEDLKRLAISENIGVAFVSFRGKDCVTETIDEIDIVKTQLGKDHFEAL